MPCPQDFGHANRILSDWKPSKEAAELSKETLDTVTHLTEYQDDKANRILTAVALLSALAGVLYSAAAPRDSGQNLVIDQAALDCGPRFLLWLFHGLMVVYLFATVLGILIVLRGIRPQFNLPRSGGGKPKKMESPLFAIHIAKRHDAEWAEEFASSSDEALSHRYARCRVLEAHLIAGKVVTKLWYVQLGTKIFACSTILLAIWIVVAALLKLVVRIP